MPRLEKLPPVWTAVLALAVVRILVMLSRFDEIELELYNGSLAWALLHGLPLDTTQLPVVVHLRGSVIFGLVTVPFMALLGPTLWTLKLVALLWSMASAGLLAKLLDVCAGRHAALAGGLIYAFMPPSFQMVDVLGLGSHGQVITFMVGTLLFVLTRDAESIRSRRTAAIFGFLCGLGLLFSLQFLAVAPALVVALCLHERRLTGSCSLLRSGLGTGLALVIALAVHFKLLAPLISDVLPLWVQLGLIGVVLLVLAMRWRSQLALPFVGALLLAGAPIPFLSRSTKIVDRELSERILPDGVGGALEKLVRAVTSEFHEAWLFSHYGGVLAYALFGVVLLVGLGFTLRRALRGEPLSAFLVLYPLGFTLLYAVTDLRLELEMVLDGMGSRYTMPLMATEACWIAIGVDSLRKRAGRLPAALMALVPVYCGMLGLVPLLDPGLAFRQPTPRGTQMHLFHGHIEHAAGGDLDAWLEWIDRLDTDWVAYRPAYYVAELPDQVDPQAPAEGYAKGVAALARYEAPLRHHLLFRMGMERAKVNNLRNPTLLTLIEGELEYQDLAWFLRGAGAGWARHYSIAFFKSKKLAEETRPKVFHFLKFVPDAMRAHALQGAGFELGLSITPYLQISLDLAGAMGEELEGSDLANAFAALALGYRTHFVEGSYFRPEPGALRLENLIPEEGLIPFRAGLAAPTERYPSPR